MKFFISGSISDVGIFLLCAISVTGVNVSEKSDKFQGLNGTFFITEIFDKYGNNNFMTYEGFEHLLENLGLGKLKFERKHDVSIHKINGSFLEFHDKLLLHKHNHSTPKESEEDVPNKRKRRNLKTEESDSSSDVVITLKRKCLTAQDILMTYGLQPYHDAIISPSKYLQICPAIVYELDQKLCQVEEVVETSRNREDYYLVWIYASLSIFIMGISGILCVFVVPLVRRNYYGSLLQFLISLAVGTLSGDALIHLLPQVITTDDKVKSDLTPVLRGTVTLLAIFFFFVIENVLKGIQSQKETSTEPVNEFGKMLPFDNHQHGHSHGMKGIKTLAWMAIIGDILHNVTDGLSIGAAFTSSLSSGFASSIAIFCHELPHELGDYAILLASGMSIKKSLFFNIISTVFSFIGMVAGVLLGEIENSSSWINAFTAGSFLYIALSDLIPEIKLMSTNSKNFIIQMAGLSCGGILMFSIALYEDQIESMLS